MADFGEIDLYQQMWLGMQAADAECAGHSPPDELSELVD
jgi:hypothetical protein